MNKKEIKKLIEAEKQQLRMFLRFAQSKLMDDAEVEKQINFYLDSISKLKTALENAPE